MAASSSTIPISIDLQLADLQKKLGEIPGITGDAAKGMLRELVSASKKAEKAVKDANSAAFKDVDKSAAEAREGLLELGDAAGLPIDQMKKLGTGFEAALTSMTSAQLGLVAFGGAAGAAVLALGAAVTVSYAVVESIVSLTQASADAIPGLQELGKVMGEQLIAKEDVERIRSADAALDGVGASASLAGAALASQLAPQVQQVATFLIAANLALADFINSNSEMVDVLVGVGTAIVDQLIAPLKGAILLLGGMLARSADLAESLDADLAASLRSVGDELLTFGESTFSDNIDGMTAALGNYIPQAEKLVVAQTKVNLALKETKTITEADFIAGVNAAIASTTDLFNTTDLAAQEANAAIDDIIAAVNEVGDAAEESAAQVADLGRSLGDDIVGITGAVSGGLESIATLIGGPVAGAIASLLLNLQDSVANIIEQLKSLPGIVEAIPSLITSLVETLLIEVVPALLLAIPDLVEGLLKAIPEIVTALVNAVPEIVTAFIYAAPNIIQAIILALPDIIVALVSLVPFLIADLMKGFQEALQFAWDWLLGDGIQDLGTALVQAFKDAWAALQDALGNVFGGDQRSVHDSPGPMRAGARGMTLRVAPNDYVAAHRTREGLADMTGGGGGAPGPVLVDFAFAGRAFDGFFARQARTGQTAAFLRSGVRTGRGR